MVSVSIVQIEVSDETDCANSLRLVSPKMAFSPKISPLESIPVITSSPSSVT